MSKTLKLDTLKGFRPKGVNVDRAIIDSALEEFNINEKAVAPSNSKEIESKNTSVNVGDGNSLLVIKDEYEKKIALLKKKVEIAESQNKSLSKNEEKLLSAIRSERINQSLEEPIIGRSMLIKKYRMNSKYLDDSIKGLEERRIVERKQIPYSAKIMTNSWKLL